MPADVGPHLPRPVAGVLLDLLMAVMDSLAIWSAAARDHRRGLAWRDAVTARMVQSAAYVSYEELVATVARELHLPDRSTPDLFEAWGHMDPWPDATSLARLTVPYGFVTNCSRRLAMRAARRSGLRPDFVLSAEEAGWYKPDARTYRAARRKLGVPPRGVLFVAGSAYDATGARRAGLRAAYVARRSDQDLPDSGIARVTSLDEIVAAIDRHPQAFRAPTQ